MNVEAQPLLAGGAGRSTALQRLSDRGISTSALVVAAIVAGGAVLRLICLRQGLFGDELFTYTISTRVTVGEVLDGVRSPLEITPPLYFLLAWAAAKVGDPVVFIRLPSLLAGLGAIPATYVLGKVTVGRRAGLVGAALMALSPFAIFYSTEARAYSVMTLLVLLSTLALLRALDTGGAGWWIGYAICTSLAVYSHYTAGFALSAQLVWALWFHRGGVRALLLANAAAALSFLPWVPGLREDMTAPAKDIAAALLPFTLDSFTRFTTVWFAGSPFVELRLIPGLAALLLIAAALLMAGAALMARRSKPTSRVVLILLLAVAAPAGASLYSLVGTDIFFHRNLAVSQPALFLTIGALITLLGGRRAVAVAVAIGGAFVFAGVSSVTADYRRPPYRQAAAFVDQELGRGDVVLVRQIPPLPPTGPPSEGIQVFLREPHKLYRAGLPGAEDAALEAARGGRLAVISPQENSTFARAIFGDRAGAPAAVAGLARLPVVERRTYTGFVPISVHVYDLRNRP